MDDSTDRIDTAPVAPSAGHDALEQSAVEGGPTPENLALDDIAKDHLRAQVLEALKIVRDPEIPVNVVDLGLVYRLDVSDDGEVDIEMTLTSPGCPVQDMIQADAELAAMKVEGVRRANVAFVWSPPWTPEKMTEDGKKQMRMFGFNI